MAKKGKVEVSIAKLEDLYESLKKTPVLEVGVFGNKNSRKEDNKSGPSNADLACAHEYGVPQHNLPSRSVLRTPLHDHAKEIMEAAKDRGEMLLTKEGVKKLWDLIGAKCISVVDQAFATGGFGKWAHLKRSTLLAKLKGSLKKRRKTISQIQAGTTGEGILIDHRELERAYSWRVRFKL